MKERVIFRTAFDPYMKIWKYLAVFPDDEANAGHIVAVPFWFKHDGKRVIEPLTEIALEYYYKTKLIHKNSKIIDTLIDALKYFYGNEFECEVREKITK